MLTLFPRIKPNPPAPPPMPAEPPEPDPVPAEPVANLAVPVVTPEEESATAQESAVAIAISPAERPPDHPNEDATPPPSITDSDLFAAFMSGLASGNSDPFIVEISARPAFPVAPELPDLEQDSTQSVSLASDSAAIVDGTSAVPSESEFVADAPPNRVAFQENNETVTDALPGSESQQSAFPTPQLYIAAANIFDELDVLHEAAAAPVAGLALEPDEPTLEAGLGKMPELARDSAIRASEIASETAVQGNAANPVDRRTPASKAEFPPSEEVEAAEAPPSIDAEAVERGVGLESNSPDHNQTQPASNTAEPESPIESLAAETEAVEKANDSAALQQPRKVGQSPQESVGEIESSPPSPTADSAAQEQQALAVAAQPLADPTKKAAFRAQLLPPKPKRVKGTLGRLVRVPEPEAMEDSAEVEAYCSAAAQSHLDAIDDTFVAHAQLLLKGRERGRALDIGTGPGQIVMKLGYRLSLWKFIGIDRSRAMIGKARESLETAGELAGRVEFRIADGNALSFADKTFDLVVCNSVLHHIADPQKLFAEIARVVKPGGAILLRDLRRPSRWGYSYHAWKHGKYYTGEMRRLFMASVMAAYTEEELQKLLASSALRDIRVFRHGKTHIGFERPIAPAAERKR